MTLTRDDLRPYQERAVDFIIDNPKVALWIDMGLGKTGATLTAINHLVAHKTVKRTLIIAPKKVAILTWPDELQKWQHLNLTHHVLAGLTGEKRIKALTVKADLHIINRENIPWLVEYYGQRWPYDCVVIDESTSFKSHTAKRWKALRKVQGKIKRMVQLTGTPAPNSLLELWPQFYLLDKGQRLENTRGKFLAKYCTLIGNPQWNQWEVAPGREAAIHRAVSDITLVMKTADYIHLPPRIDISIPVTLPPSGRKAYEAMKRDFLLAYDQGEILSVNAAVQINKLLQISNGNIYTESGQYLQLHRAKLDALAEVIENCHEPVLIAYYFKSDLLELQRIYPQGEMIGEDKTVLERWNRGVIPICFHHASAGHGLNLQAGGAVIIWYGLIWSLEQYQQFNKRLHRQGQSKPVRVYHLLAENTVDAEVLKTLQHKKTTQDRLLAVVDYLKQRTD